MVGYEITRPLDDLKAVIAVTEVGIITIYIRQISSDNLLELKYNIPYFVHLSIFSTFMIT